MCYRIVVLRGKEIARAHSNLPTSPPSDVNGLRDDIALLQIRLETKLKEGRNLSSELGTVSAEKQKLQCENTRFNHRIEYLEDQVAELENGMKAVRDSLAHTLNTEIQDTITKLDAIGKAGMPMTEALFQKGGHVAHVKVPMAAVLEGLGGQQDEQLSTALPEEGERHVARMIVKDETRNSDFILPPPKPCRTSQEQSEERKGGMEGGMERSNSRVTARVTNLMRWPRKEKEGQAKNSFV